MMSVDIPTHFKKVKQVEGNNYLIEAFSNNELHDPSLSEFIEVFSDDSGIYRVERVNFLAMQQEGEEIVYTTYRFYRRRVEDI